MGPVAQAIWDTLELRTPTMLRAVEPLSEADLRWEPPGGANSIAWLLWHIAEVEDNWIRDKLYGLPKQYPFGASVKLATLHRFPSKGDLLDYFRDVRALTRQRLEEMRETEFERDITDEHFGPMTVRQLWAGVASSCAWHGGQIVMISNRLLPSRGSPDWSSA